MREIQYILQDSKWVSTLGRWEEKKRRASRAHEGRGVGNKNIVIEEKDKAGTG